VIADPADRAGSYQQIARILPDALTLLRDIARHANDRPADGGRGCGDAACMPIHCHYPRALRHEAPDNCQPDPGARRGHHLQFWRHYAFVALPVQCRSTAARYCAGIDAQYPQRIEDNSNINRFLQ